MKRLFCAMLLAASLSGLSTANAQTPAGAPANPVIESTPGKIYRVDTGIVEVKLGAPFDISSKKIITIFTDVKDTETPNAYAKFRMKNNEYNIGIGNRFDVKTYSNEKDLGECTFDLIGIKAPKGATPAVVLRVNCD